MEKRFSILERIVSDTPTFFKRAQLFGISLAGLGTSLTQVIGIPAKLCMVLISIGSTITILGQFAVKQYQYIDDKRNDEVK